MAEAVRQNLSTSFEGMSNLPILKQLGLLIGLAASIALGASIVMWSQSPQYSLLYSGLTGSDAAQVVQALDTAAISYKIDQKSGAILVAGNKVHAARLQLAGQGLPKGSGTGFEMLQEEQSFGTSRFVENARFQRALETELARSISELKGVRSARIHLAMPKQSVFIRKNIKPTASVLLNLYPGRAVEKGQVNAIVHLVSASIPGMDPSGVKVLDQNGKLLSSSGSDSEIGMSNSQFEYTQQLERSYIRRIENILSPIMGDAGVRAQVVADVDFTITERTSETFNPDLPAIRSEQTLEESSTTGVGAQGIPGAATNQPGAVPGPTNTSQPESTTRRATRNYELDKTVSHTRLATGTLKRLSVAVVVDDKRSVDEDDEVTITPLTPEEINRLTILVKEAVGFNAQRGDSVNLINSSFFVAPGVEPLPEPAIWEQTWVWDLAKQIGAVALVIILAMMVLRPMMRNLSTVPPQRAMMPASADAQMAMAGQQTGEGGMGGMPAQIAGPNNYENQLTSAKELVSQDPRRVAQVVKTWVVGDHG